MKKIIILLTLLLLVGGGFGTFEWINIHTVHTSSATTSKSTTYSVRPKSIRLLSGTSYPNPATVKFQFQLIDAKGKVYSAFDTSKGGTPELFLIRSDRTNFQYLIPSFDKQTSTFTSDNIQLSTSGVYRLYLQFIAANATTDSEGNKSATVLSKDITVGTNTINNYGLPLPERLTSTTNGFDTSLYFPSGDSPSAQQQTSFTPGSISNIDIAINKNGIPFKSLQPYGGSLGQLAVFGSNLEFASAHAAAPFSDQQSGLLVYSLSFPGSGIYKMYMQTKALDQVSTFDYNVLVNSTSAKPGG